MEQSESIAKLSEALAAAQKEMPVVAKDKVNPFFKAKYADLHSVVQAVKDVVPKHGLSVMQLPDFDGDHDLLTTQLCHSSGEWVRSSMRLMPVKQDPQAQGSAITYARRYAYCSILGIVADEDDDGNAASTPPKAQGTTKRVATASPASNGNGTGPNLGKLYAILRGNKSIAQDDEGRHSWAAGVLSRPITSFKELTQEDVNLLEKKAKEPAGRGAYTGDPDGEMPF